MNTNSLSGASTHFSLMPFVPFAPNCTLPQETQICQFQIPPSKTLRAFHTNTKFPLINPEHSNEAQCIESLQDQISTLKLQQKSEKLKLNQENFELQQLNYELACKVQEHSQIKKHKYKAVILKKDQEIEGLVQELNELKTQYAEDLKNIQLKASASLSEIAGQYKQELIELRLKVKELQCQLNETKESKELVIKQRISEEVYIERRKLYKKINQLTGQKNEAHAKLELCRTELKALNSMIETNEPTQTYINRIDTIVSVLSQSQVNPSDLEWVFGNLVLIKDQLSRLEAKQKIHERVLAKKDCEFERLELLSKKSQSPPLSKAGTTRCSPTSSEDAFIFASFSPLKPFGNFSRDSRTRIKKTDSDRNDAKLVSELAELKLKYALLQEFIVTRDNDLKALLSQLKKFSDPNQSISALITALLERISDTAILLS